MPSNRIAVPLALVVLVLAGCSTREPDWTGFLSDYSRLVETDSTSWRYIAPGDRLRDYVRFIVEPVAVHVHEGENEATEASLIALAEEFRATVITLLAERYEIVTEPRPRTAIVRLALTDVERSRWWEDMHHGAGLGKGPPSASMEGELLDSFTGVQIAALVETQTETAVPLATFAGDDGVDAILDDWAGRLRARLDEAHDKGL